MSKGFAAALAAAGLMAAASGLAQAAPGDSVAAAPPAQTERAPYRPVTDAMLTNPDAGDWLSWRRSRQRLGLQPAGPDHAPRT